MTPSDTGSAGDNVHSMDDAARQRAMLASIVDFAIIGMDRGGRVVEWNTGAERILGWSAREMQGHSAERIFTPEDRAAARPAQEMQLALSNGRSPDERWHLRIDGGRFWASGELMPLRNDLGEHIGFVKVLRDSTQQRLAQEDLRHEREQLAQMFEQAPTFMAVLRGPEHRFERVNPGYVRLAGERPLLGLPLAEALPDAVEQGFLTILDEAYRSGVAYQANGVSYARQLVPGGPVVDRYVDVVYQPLRDVHGQVNGIFVEGADVTDRRAANDALAESEARYRTLFEGVDSGFCIVEMKFDDAQRAIDYRIIEGNKAFEAMTGLRDSKGKWVSDIAPGLERHWFDRYGAVALTGERTRFEHGAEPFGRWYDVQAMRIGDPAAHRVAILFNDLTERKAIEARQGALLELGDAMRDLVDPVDIAVAASGVLARALGVSRVGYGVIDKVAETITVERDWNAPGVETLAGVLDFRDYGSYIENLKCGETVAIDDARADPRTAATAASLEGISARAFVNMPLVEQGQFVALLYANHAEARRWSEGDLLLMRQVAERVRSTTERVRSEEALRTSIEGERRQAAALAQLNETLEEQVQARTGELMAVEEALRQSQKMEAVGQLTGGLAHDFNNLLTGIIGSLELLSVRAAQGRLGEVERFTSVAQGAAKRAAALTHRLLAFSRRQTLDPKPTDVNRLVSGMEDLVRRTVGPAVEVEVVTAGGLWSTLVDPNQLENALLNLCINARDAMPEGGRLTIETGNRWLDARASRERGLDPGQYVSLCVSDNGTGMTPEVIAKAFDPFFTTKPLGLGTGLGLSMIYGFARQSGGQVRIYSEVGEGAMVCIYLPRHRGAAEEMETVPELSSVSRAVDGETVLIVDDEPTVRLLVTEVLEELGYAAIEAADGASGLKLLESGLRVDLLVTDVGLPGGMNGRQMADAARVSRPDLKVLFITGYAENAVVGNGHLDPEMHVMTKPFALEALAARMKQLIQGK